MAGAFGFDDGAGGLFVVVKNEPLTAGCLSVEEIDAAIMGLQAELDRVGAQMKRAVGVRNPSVFFAQDPECPAHDAR